MEIRLERKLGEMQVRREKQTVESLSASMRDGPRVHMIWHQRSPDLYEYLYGIQRKRRQHPLLDLQSRHANFTVCDGLIFSLRGHESAWEIARSQYSPPLINLKAQRSYSRQIRTVVKMRSPTLDPNTCHRKPKYSLSERLEVMRRLVMYMHQTNK